MDAASISGSSGSLPEPADLSLGLHKRARRTGKATRLAEAPEDLPLCGKDDMCSVCSGDYYGDCDFYSVKVAPAACPRGASSAGCRQGHKQRALHMGVCCRGSCD